MVHARVVHDRVDFYFLQWIDQKFMRGFPTYSTSSIVGEVECGLIVPFTTQRVGIERNDKTYSRYLHHFKLLIRTSIWAPKCVYNQ